MDLRQICLRDVKAQAMVDSDLPLPATVTSGRAPPMPIVGTCGIGEKKELNVDRMRRQRSKRLLTQEVANKAGITEHPFCLNCGPSVLGSAQHRLWACPAYRETGIDFRPISMRDRPRLVTNSSGREA